MVLFLITAVPLFVSFCLALFFPEEKVDRGIIVSYLKGLLWFFPALVAFLLLRGMLSVEYSASGLYLYYLLHDYLFPVIPAILGYLLFFRVLDSKKSRPDLDESTMFFAGYFSLFGLLELILRFRWFDVQILFLRPVIFIIMVLYLSGMVFLAFSNEGWLRSILIFGAVASSAALACIPLLFRLSFRWISIALCIALFGAALFFFRTNVMSRRTG